MTVGIILCLPYDAHSNDKACVLSAIACRLKSMCIFAVRLGSTGRSSNRFHRGPIRTIHLIDEPTGFHHDKDAIENERILEINRRWASATVFQSAWCFRNMTENGLAIYTTHDHPKCRGPGNTSFHHRNEYPSRGGK